MAFDLTAPSVSDATKLNDYLRLRANDVANAQKSFELGGSLGWFVINTAYGDISPEYIEREIDGTNLSGLSVHLEVNVRAHPSNSGTVTVSVQLFNTTTVAAVASSEVAVAALAAGARAHSKSSAITLATGLNKYKAQIKTSDVAKQVSAVAWISIRG
jgi:hypothetical protein